MSRYRSILLLVLYSLSGAVSGRASFNDTLAVGIGDPFDLLKRELAFVAVSRLTAGFGEDSLPNSGAVMVLILFGP
jgi:hypothetical protein